MANLFHYFNFFFLFSFSFQVSTAEFSTPTTATLESNYYYAAEAAGALKAKLTGTGWLEAGWTVKWTIEKWRESGMASAFCWPVF